MTTKINTIDDINPAIWSSLNRGNKYNDKIDKLKQAGSTLEYKKLYPDKETPQEYKERHQRNTEKYKKDMINHKKRGTKGSSSQAIIALSNTMERKPKHLKTKINNNKPNPFKYKEKKKKNSYNTMTSPAYRISI